jgi:hypothetical protein
MAIGVLYVLAAWSLYSSTSREAFGGVHYSAAENLLHMALSVVLLFALTQAMTTVLPGPQSDRLALKRLKAESVAFEVYLLIYADTCMRKRPRDWHIESMDGFEKNGHRHSKYGCYCKAVTMLDVGRERESLTQLDELMPSLTPKDAEIQEAALGLVAFLHARSGDMEDARALIDLLESGPPKHKDMLFASKAAFAFSQGDEKSADAFFASAELSLRDQVKHWSLFHDFALELLQRYKEPLQQVPQTDPRPDGTA